MFKTKLIVFNSIFMFFVSSLVMGHTIPKKGMKADLVLLPKFLGILPFNPNIVRPNVQTDISLEKFPIYYHRSIRIHPLVQASIYAVFIYYL